MSNLNLEQKNAQLQNTQHHLQKMVGDYTHDVGSLIRPEIVYRVAQEIKEQFPEQFFLLSDVYHAEISVRHKSEALRIKHVMQNPETFRALIRRDNRPDSLYTATDIKNILNDSLQKMVRDFLYYPKLSTIRDMFLQSRNISWQNLQKSFTKQIFFQSKPPIAWTQENLFSIQLLEFSPLWEKIKFKKYGATENLLYGYFVELFFNVFKYSNYQWLKLRFYEQNIKGCTYLLSAWENAYCDNQSISTGNGLDSICEELQMLNESKDEATTLQVIDNQLQKKFGITLALKKDLLIYETEKCKHPRPKKKVA